MSTPIQKVKRPTARDQGLVDWLRWLGSALANQYDASRIEECAQRLLDAFSEIEQLKQRAIAVGMIEDECQLLGDYYDLPSRLRSAPVMESLEARLHARELLKEAAVDIDRFRAELVVALRGLAAAQQREAELLARIAELER